MFHYKIILSYKGKNYQGWQDQGPCVVTVQGEIKKRLKSLFTSYYFNFFASSRTDRGVDCDYQISKLSCPIQITELQIKNIECDNIKVLSFLEVMSTFNPNNIEYKTYEYRFSDLDVKQSGVYTHYKKVDYEKMSKTLYRYRGKLDFKNYSTKYYKNSVRTIFSIEMSEDEGIYTLSVTGDGFLKYMVRYIAGEIIKIGEGVERNIKFKAPACGLCLKYQKLLDLV